MPITSGNRITKSSRSKGSAKPELSAVVAKIQNKFSTTTEASSDNKTEKKGIVIDGKTYTCATCKSGHRVSVCKHAKERPMSATNPPGRPAAGSTKKVVCDCPRTCACTSKSCKCQRVCTCIQTMYMLVYIAGPDEAVDQSISDEEKGTWKIGEAVTTDLQGRILSEEEVEHRRQQKEIQKDGQSTTTSENTSDNSNIYIAIDNIRSPSSTMQNLMPPSEATPRDVGGCCKHRAAVATEVKRAAELPTNFAGYNPAMSARCNCGDACGCAFCPEHSNNATSHHAIRQQADNLYQQYAHIPVNAISTPFNTGITPGMSCMGGQPRFALSRYPNQFSLANFDQAFPTSGGSGAYVIAYPMHPRHTPMTPTPDVSSDHMFSNEVDTNGILGMEQTPSLSLHTPFSNGQNFADYDIGEAVVVNDGPNGWQQSEWPNTGLVTPDPFTDFGNQDFSLAEQTAFDDLVSLPPWDGASLGQDGTIFPSTSDFSEHNDLPTPLPS